MRDFLEHVIAVIVCIAMFIGIILCFQCLFVLGSYIKAGTGQYTGIITGTAHHGILFKTNAISTKTGLNSSSEDGWCVLDKGIMKQLQQLPPHSEVTITYKSFLMTPSWECDFVDSDDIITSFKVIK